MVQHLRRTPGEVDAFAVGPFRATPWNASSADGWRLQWADFAGPPRGKARPLGPPSAVSASPPASSIPRAMPDPIGQGSGQGEQPAPHTHSQAASTAAPSSGGQEEDQSEVQPFIPTASTISGLSGLTGYSWAVPQTQQVLLSMPIKDAAFAPILFSGPSQHQALGPWCGGVAVAFYLFCCHVCRAPSVCS